MDDVLPTDIDQAVLPRGVPPQAVLDGGDLEGVTSCGTILRRKTWASGFS
jgi:hypothetical protein